MVNERQLLSWISASPSEEAVKNSRKITLAQVRALEEEWKSGKDPSVSQMESKNVANVELEPILLSYENAKHYKSVMLPLIEVEAEYEKNLKESLMIDNINVRWEGDIQSNASNVIFGCITRYSF